MKRFRKMKLQFHVQDNFIIAIIIAIIMQYLNITLKDKKLKIVNLMTRRESQACLERTEGVRKNKFNRNVDSA